MEPLSLSVTSWDFVDEFVDLYRGWIIPEVYLHWAALSVLAAAVEDRVCLRMVDFSPLYPNLWVFLVGDSGTGKDSAIGAAQQLLPKDALWCVDGKVTISGLYDYMERQQRASQRPGAPVYLVSSDVVEQLPIGAEAMDFMSRVLPLYGGRDRELIDITRTSGTKTVNRPLLNWIAGCTRSWFPRAVHPDVFTAGFAGRTVFVCADPVYEAYEVITPPRKPDHDARMERLRRHCRDLLAIEGEFVFTDRGEIFYQQWLAHQVERLRTTQLADVERNVLTRARTTVVKLAMVYALSRWRPGKPLVVDDEAIVRADRAFRDVVVKNIVTVATYAYQSPETQARVVVEEIIRLNSPISRTKLMRYAMERGVKTSRHLTEILEVLLEAQRIRMEQKTTGGRPMTLYTWIVPTVRLPHTVGNE
jgi:hypothetical protein